MVSTVVCSLYEGGLVDVMSDVFISRKSMFFMCSDLIPSSFILMIVSNSNLDYSNFPSIMLLTIIFSSRSSKDVASVDILFS